jgi:hypothetical protein
MCNVAVTNINNCRSSERPYLLHWDCAWTAPKRRIKNFNFSIFFQTVFGVKQTAANQGQSYKTFLEVILLALFVSQIFSEHWVNFFIFIKWSSLPKDWVKLLQKSFIRLTPGYFFPRLLIKWHYVERHRFGTMALSIITFSIMTRIITFR